VAVDKSGNVYVADKDNFVIREITPDGRVSTIAGKPGVAGFTDGKGQAARFKEPRAVAVDTAGNVYVVDSANQAIRKITPAGEVSSVALGLFNPENIAVDSAGVLYVTDSTGVEKISNGKTALLPPLMLTGSPDGPIAHPDGIAVDKHGTIYISDTIKDVVGWKAK
jgi:streptogramin lyase